MSTKYKLVRISLEEYRALYDAGAWVYGDVISRGNEILGCMSDAEDELVRRDSWTHCYARVESGES